MKKKNSKEAELVKNRRRKLKSSRKLLKPNQSQKKENKTSFSFKREKISSFL